MRQEGHFIKNPILRKRLNRFFRLKRASLSLFLLVILYVVSMGAELVCNSRPILLCSHGKLYFPFLSSSITYDTLLKNGNHLQADFIKLQKQGLLDDCLVLWPILRNDPYRIISPEELQPFLRKTVHLVPIPKIAGITLDQNLQLVDAQNIEAFCITPVTLPVDIQSLWSISTEDLQCLNRRWSTEAAPETLVVKLTARSSSVQSCQMIFSPSGARKKTRKNLRARLVESSMADHVHYEEIKWVFETRDAHYPVKHSQEYMALPEDIRNKIAGCSQNSSLGEIEFPHGVNYDISVEFEESNYPFRPVKGHPCGIDSAGRDVLARMLYALRVAMNFGLILVICSLSLGAVFGIIQGLSGGIVDLIGQRLIELWSALPFLYVMILMGALYGTGFGLLLVCYALFNWIGISYYMRAETLRIRKMPYIDAARCLGVSYFSIAFRHVLPNALTPLITMFPFSLVGAIGALAALDYLGFGLPPPSPSLGELLAQAQVVRSAWWLTLYPSLTLFIIMLLGVFLGEGLRNAFDPKQHG